LRSYIISEIRPIIFRLLLK